MELIPQLLRSLATVARRQALLLVSRASHALLLAMESCNQWIIEMLERDETPPPSWVSAVVEDASNEDEELDQAQSLPAAWVSASSASSSSSERRDSSVPLFGTSSESTDDASDEAERDSTDGDLADNEEGDDDQGGEKQEDVMVSDVGALKAACEFYMMRCEQMREKLRHLSAELIETRGVLERRLELEGLRRSPSTAIKLITEPLARVLSKVWSTRLEEKRPAAFVDPKTTTTNQKEPSQVDAVDEGAPHSPSLEQSATVVIGFEASDVCNGKSSDVEATSTGTDSSTSLPSPTEETLFQVLPDGGFSFGGDSSTFSRSPIPSVALPADGDQRDECEVVVTVNPKGTSYRQLTELPVKRDDGSWHRHILRLLSAERELRRQKHRQGHQDCGYQTGNATSSTTTAV